MTGTLYGVGLGPGAPDLMTLRAARLIEGASVVAYPTLAGAASFARAIASDLIGPDVQEIVMDVPMSVERAPAQAAYDTGAAEIAAALDAGHDVVCLCEGDPFFYGSFMHLHSRLHVDCAVDIVPAITGMSAAWTATGIPITWGDDVLTVLMGTMPEAELTARLRATDALVIMKIGRNLPTVRRALKAAGLMDRAWLVQYAAMEGQSVQLLSGADVEAVPYFSIIVVHGRGRRP